MLGNLMLQGRKMVTVEYDPAEGTICYPGGRVVSLVEVAGELNNVPAPSFVCMPYLDEILEITGLWPVVFCYIMDHRLLDRERVWDPSRMLMSGVGVGADEVVSAHQSISCRRS